MAWHGMATELEAIFQLIFSIIYLQGREEEESAMVKAVITSLTANKTQVPRRRLSVLVVLFNLIYKVESKVDILLAIFNYAIATGLTNLVAQLSSRVEEWIAAWGLSATQQRPLLKVLGELLQADKQGEQSLQVIIRYLQTFKGQALDREAQQTVVTALVQAVQSPLEVFSDRLALHDVVSTLSVSEEASKLLSLLKVLCDGGLDDFQSQRGALTAVLNSHKLSADDIEHKLRILSLCSLASQVSPKRDLTFASISAALKVDVADVEIWVVEAVAAGLLDASIDQLQSVVTVNRFSYRSFGNNDWKALQKGLKELAAQLNTVAVNKNS
eukprot:scaffold16029_cov179-Ochromonas_danica.AAC.2